jgi:hypothetical protein
MGNVADSNLLPDYISLCTLLTSSCVPCGYLGRNPREGVKLGRTPRKVTQMNFTLSLTQRVSPISLTRLQTDDKYPFHETSWVMTAHLADRILLKYLDVR